jgi:TetR/AcrR family transcriptional regulator
MTEPPTKRPKRSRGRPPASEGPAVTREELLAIASRAIGQRGFDRSSIRAIADEAGVSNRSVQHHFPTKDDLWRALVDEVIVPELKKEVSAEPSDVPARIREDVQARVELAITRPGLSAAVLADSSEGDRGRLEYLAAAIADTRDQNIETWRALMEAGALRGMDPRSMMITISIAVPFISSAKTAVDVLYGVDLEDPTQRDALNRDIADLLLYGLLPRPDEGNRK